MNYQKRQIGSFRSCTLDSAPDITFTNHCPTDLHYDHTLGFSESSRQSSMIREEEVLQKKRKQMQQLINKYQEQKKCIKQLQNYIDELESANQLQQLQIQRLEASLAQIKLKNSDQKEKMFEVEVQPVENKSKLWNTMQEQFYLYEKEKKKWEIESQLKEKELHLEIQLQAEKYQDMKQIYESKLAEIEEKWRQRQKIMREQIRSLEAAEKLASKENIELGKKVSEQDQFRQVMKVRRSLLNLERKDFKQNQNSNMICDIYKREIEKLNDQLKKVKRDCIKLQKILENKERNFDKEKQEGTSKDQKISQLQLKNQILQKKIEKEKEEMTKKIEQEERACWTIRSQFQELQKEHQNCIQKEKVCQSSRDESRKMKAELRKRSNAEILKMDKLFENLDYELDI